MNIFDHVTRIGNKIYGESLVFFLISMNFIDISFHFIFDKHITSHYLLVDIVISVILMIHFRYYIKIRKKVNLGFYNKYTETIEIISCLPFVFLQESFNLSGWVLGLYVLRIIRIFRIIKLFGIMDSVGKLTKTLKIIERFILSYLTVHLIGCGWVYLHGVEKGSIFDIYVKAIYWVITTMTTIGYGDITPQTSITRIYTMFVMISGVAVYGFVIGNFSKFLTEENKFKEGHKEKMFNLVQFMKYYNVPKKLQEESIDFMGHISSDRLTDDDSKIISELPETLQNDLKIYMKMKIIDTIPLFQGTTFECQKELSLFLREKSYSPGGLIIEKGTIGNEMFIIDHGRVEISIGDDIVNTMSDGEFFGEIALIKSTTRMADVKAISYCKIYFLERNDFMTLTKEYPLLDDRIKKMVKKYG